jgi:hypothetical protein
MEEYKKIQNYDYSVSNLGNVRNDVTNRILQPGINSNGYYNVTLYKNGKTKNMTVHKLVAVAFIPNPNDKTCVDHINNNKLDNNISNLRWCTYQENNQNRSMRNDNSSGVKGISWHKRDRKWIASIQVDGIKIHIGNYNTIEEASIARVQRARQTFGQYVNASEGINHGLKPMQISKPKKVIQQIVKTDVQQIYDNIVKLNNALKIKLMDFQM